jgi:hypothetical protein
MQRRVWAKSRRTIPIPRPSRRFRPLTSLSRCGCLAPIPIRLEALVLLRICAVTGAHLSSRTWTSSMSPTVEARGFATPAPFGSERALLRSRRLLSCRSRGARARVRFGFSGRDDRLRDSASCSLSAWFPASLPARIPYTALAAPGRLERRSRDVETERATAFPRGPTGACLTRCVTRARARRARPPPFAPRGAASPASPRGAASLSSVFGISCETPPSGSPDSRRFEDDASGRPALFCAGSTGPTWGGTRRRPRSIRPMSAAHGFSFQR